MLTIKPLVLSGRTFRLADATTIRQDMQVASIMRRAGMNDSLSALATAVRGEKDEDDAIERLVLGLYDAGALFLLLATVLTEDGHPWTVAHAAEVAEFFENLKSAEDKAALQQSLAGVIVGFTIGALGFDATSLTSSPKAGSPESADLAAAPISPTLSADADASTPSGAASSASSPDMTGTASS